MATKTWQNGGVNNNWSTAGNWVEGSKPAAGDDVIMSAAYDCVVDENTASLKSFNMTGYANTLSGTGTIIVRGLTASTNVVIFSGILTWTGTLQFSPVSTTAVLNFTSGGLLFTTITVTSGNALSLVVLQDDLNFTTDPNCAIILTTKAFDLNGKTISGNSAVRRTYIRGVTVGTKVMINLNGGNFANANFRDIIFYDADETSITLGGTNNDAIVVPPSNAINIYDSGTPSAPFTFEAWIYPTGAGDSGVGSIVQKDNSTSTATGYKMHLFSHSGGFMKVGANVDHGDGTDANMATAATTNRVVQFNVWNHVCMVYNEDGDKKIKVYVNGSAVALSTQTAGIGDVINDSLCSAYIGNRWNGQATFDGRIRGVRVYHGIALTAAQVAANAAGSPTAGFTAYWGFTEGTGTTITDSVGGLIGTATDNLILGVYTAAELPWFSIDLSAIVGNSGDGGGNSGAIFTTAETQTWAYGGVDRNWSTVGNWTSRVPLPQDDVVLTGTSTITADIPQLGNNISFAEAAPLTLATYVSSGGSVNFTGAGTFTPGTNIWYFNSIARVGTVSLISAGKTFYQVQFACGGSSVMSLDDAFRCSNSTTVSSICSIRLNSYTHTFSYPSTGVAINFLGIVDAGTSTIVLSSTSTSIKTFAGGGNTFYNLTTPAGTGGVAITGSNIFQKITVTPGGRLIFPSSTTTRIRQFVATGSSGNIITLRSSTGGSAATLLKIGDSNVQTDWLDITDVNVTPANTWYYGNNSTWHSGTGWKAGLAPSGSGFGRGNFGLSRFGTNPFGRPAFNG